jgi:hypothetical protein
MSSRWVATAGRPRRRRASPMARALQCTGGPMSFRNSGACSDCWRWIEDYILTAYAWRRARQPGRTYSPERGRERSRCYVRRYSRFTSDYAVVSQPMVHRMRGRRMRRGRDLAMCGAYSRCVLVALAPDACGGAREASAQGSRGRGPRLVGYPPGDSAGWEFLGNRRYGGMRRGWGEERPGQPGDEYPEGASSGWKRVRSVWVTAPATAWVGGGWRAAFVAARASSAGGQAGAPS